MKKIIVLIIAIFVMNVANAQWQQTSLGYNITIQALNISGGNIFAGSMINGVYTSSNNGNSWTTVNNGLTGTCAYTLANNDSNIFVAIDGSGVFLSSNNGGNWILVNNGMPSSITITSFAIKDSNIFAGTDEGVFLSTNNGNSWSQMNIGLTNTSVRSLAINDNNIYAGTIGGVFLSTNNGNSWANINNGMTDTNITALITNGNNIIVSSYNGPIFLSSDNGNNWSTTNTGLTNIEVFAFAARDSNIFAATDNGVLLSTNNGNSWSTMNTGLSNLDVYSIAISADNIFVGTFYGGVWKRPLSDFATLDTITTSSSPVIGGSTTGGGSFPLHETCNLKAIPNSGYVFVNWTENGDTISTDTNYTFNVTANRNLVANFSIITTNCSAQFTMIADTTTLHHYYAVNNASGIPPLKYTWSWGDGTQDTIAYPSHTYSTAGIYKICLTITDSTGCTNSYCDSSYLQKSTNSIITVNVIPQGTLGINTNQLSNHIKVYPNPTKDNLTIETNSNTEQKLEIINLIGQTVYTNIIYKKAVINTSAFANGVYILKLSSDKETVVRKFVKE